MKKIQFAIAIAILLTIGFSSAAFAQLKTETIKVAGECGTCKKKIETAAKNAGAIYASWSADTKQLSVKYNTKTSNTAKIEQAVAKTGYDTPDYKATDAAYKKLDACCRYEREAAVTVTNTDQHQAKGEKAQTCCTEGGSCCSECHNCCTKGADSCCTEGHNCCTACNNCCAEGNSGKKG